MSLVGSNSLNPPHHRCKMRNEQFFVRIQNTKICKRERANFKVKNVTNTLSNSLVKMKRKEDFRFRIVGTLAH